MYPVTNSRLNDLLNQTFQAVVVPALRKERLKYGLDVLTTRNQEYHQGDTTSIVEMYSTPKEGAFSEKCLDDTRQPGPEYLFHPASHSFKTTYTKPDYLQLVADCLDSEVITRLLYERVSISYLEKVLSQTESIANLKHLYQKLVVENTVKPEQAGQLPVALNQIVAADFTPLLGLTEWRNKVINELECYSRLPLEIVDFEDELLIRIPSTNDFAWLSGGGYEVKEEYHWQQLSIGMRLFYLLNGLERLGTTGTEFEADSVPYDYHYWLDPVWLEPTPEPPGNNLTHPEPAEPATPQRDLAEPKFKLQFFMLAMLKTMFPELRITAAPQRGVTMPLVSYRKYNGYYLNRSKVRHNPKTASRGYKPHPKLNASRGAANRYQYHRQCQLIKALWQLEGRITDLAALLSQLPSAIFPVEALQCAFNLINLTTGNEILDFDENYFYETGENALLLDRHNLDEWEAIYQQSVEYQQKCHAKKGSASQWLERPRNLRRLVKAWNHSILRESEGEK